ncbi:MULTISPECIES: hypothetical protein [unclassified Undibacterium]|uniref:tetratricopeptide repeat protein n=1 Tax=unclassified Undibacterium TaxID=2630295 RepID=UPI002AC8B0FD|nr:MULTISPECIES: hypothetical protein [unclassified Undibacterium]MEB0140065.1 hypothetical protein [Undibacterium sp. CCC2.1]MEB0173175.1 hypothetical protein [Undibacterium sp. CCC1.1]MEB0176898.1 hypothetical protein [Undibacterium sp. CCC3.4]MEB0216189.1 hypothetical protein [Undibacterium sp. 5I2]WPX41947.1 hypothetical protein RHM61_11030 [Undibacterium sp. CCC3.4]
MIIFFFLATLLLTLIVGLLCLIWKKPISLLRNAASGSPEWKLMLAKRLEIEEEVLQPVNTQTLLRQEWTQLADQVLARGPVAAVDGPDQRWQLSAAVAVLALAIYALTTQWDSRVWQSPGADAVTEASVSTVSNEASMPDSAKHPGSSDPIEQRIAQLEKKLQTAPDNLEGWVLLSRSRALQRNFSGAAQALDQALLLAPGHPDILADLADVLAMSNNKILAGRPLQLIQQALQNDPVHAKALSLAATAAMQNNDIELAADYWRRLRASFPAGAPDIAQIDAILADLPVRRAATTAATAAAAAAPAPAAATTSLAGQVSVSKELQQRWRSAGLPASATLFIIAKAPDGTAMPLAARRFPASKLLESNSLSFQLDDSQAMNPAKKLSSMQKVRLEARISMSGTPGKQAGDWFVALDDVAVGKQDVLLRIATVLP